MKKWIIAMTVSTIVVASLSVPVHLLRLEYNQQYHQKQLNQAKDYLTLIREDLQSELDNSRLNVDFFEMVIKQDADISETELEEYAKFIVERNSLIESVSIEKEGIDHLIYPSYAVESTSELPLNNGLSVVKSNDEALVNISESTLGFVDSNKDKVKIVNQKPVYTESVISDQFWGVASVIVDFEELIDSTLSDHPHSDYLMSFAIDSRNGSSYVWGDEELFSRTNVLQTITLPQNNWRLAIEPVEGWSTENVFLKSELVFSYLLLGIIYLLTFIFTAQYITKRDLSRKDVLTGLLNKHTFELTARRLLKYSSQKTGILLIDFNDFKKINDENGHLAGDKVLIESARRMKDIVKHSDRVGRIGGDEFMVIVRDLKNEEDLEKIADRIIENLEQPILHHTKQIDLTVSVGFMMTTNTLAFEHFYDLVDKKMYKHKREHKSLGNLTTNQE